MPTSTVADSIIGALGSIGGIGSRRADDGLKAVQTKTYALQNEATQRALDREEETRLFGLLTAQGYVKLREDGTGYDVDYKSMLDKAPDLATQLLGPEANNFLSTRKPDGTVGKLTLSGVRKVPAQLLAGPSATPGADSAPGAGQSQVAPQGPQPGVAPNLAAISGPISLINPPQGGPAAPTLQVAPPGQLTAGPLAMGPNTDNPADASGASASRTPDQYVIMARTEDGREVPLTENASSDPNDKMIMLDSDSIGKKLQRRVDTLFANGAANNAATTQMLGVQFRDYVAAGMRQAVINDGGNSLIPDGDPAAKRALFDAIDNAESVDELEQIAADSGIDVTKLEEQMSSDWAADHKAGTESIKTDSPDMQTFREIKSTLTRQLMRADQAIEDYDADLKRRGVKNPIQNVGTRTPLSTSRGYSSPEVKALEAQFGPQMTEEEMRNGGFNRINGRPNAPNPPLKSDAPALSDVPKTPLRPAGTDEARLKLVSARDAVVKKLASLKPPTNQFVEIPGAKPMPFELTADNLRASIRGELAKPTAEQTAAIIKDAKNQGVQTTQDIRNLPREKAQMLAWVIANNMGGSAQERILAFNNLNNMAQTDDPQKSAIDATTKIAETIVAQTNAGTSARQVDVSLLGHQMDYAAAMRTNDIRLAELNFKGYEAQRKFLGEVDDMSSNKIAPLLKEIYEGATNPDGTFKIGWQDTALPAFKELENYVNGLAPGSALREAASARYVEGFLTIAGAGAAKAGQGAWWDFAKWFANTFLREKGMVDLSSIANNIRIKKYKNGHVEEFTFAETGARDGKPTEDTTVGAAEFSRYLGSNGMDTLMDIIYSTKAANALQAEGVVSPTPEQKLKKAEELKRIDSRSANG